VRHPDPDASQRMIAAIDQAKASGDTLGGQFVVRVDGVPAGIGSNRQPNQRLDGLLAGAVMGMQTVKSVDIGLGSEAAMRPGSQAHDAFAVDGNAVVRAGNRAGGIEGGMSNGEPLLIRVSVKPIPTLAEALPSVNLHAGSAAPATVVRSDVCVVPAAAIVGEAMVRLALMAPVLEKYGGDSMEETLDNVARSRAAAASLF
jgi:chorismate synthase